MSRRNVVVLRLVMSETIYMRDPSVSRTRQGSRCNVLIFSTNGPTSDVGLRMRPKQTQVGSRFWLQDHLARGPTHL